MWDFTCNYKLPALGLGALLLLVLATSADLLGIWNSFTGVTQKDIHDTHPEISGVLLPDNAQTPPNPCEPIPPNEVVLLMEGDAYLTREFPHTILRIDGKDFLSVDKSHEGISVSAEIYSSDKKIIAEIRKNKFDINHSNYFRLERPNKHTLVVYDQQKNIALNVYFLNASAIKFSGTFHLPGRTPLVLRDADFFKNCFAYNIGADINID